MVPIFSIVAARMTLVPLFECALSLLFGCYRCCNVLKLISGVQNLLLLVLYILSSDSYQQKKKYS
jgi:hypothetical protein